MQPLEKTANRQEKQIKTLDGSGKIGYEVVGSGEIAVLCLPSLGDTRQQYERFIPGLVEAGYKVLATDLRGIGKSEGKFASYSIEALADDIKAILDAEGLTKVYLAGCSVSGASAPLFALKYPERVQGLILFNPLMRSGSRWLAWTMFLLLQMPLVGRNLWTSYFKSLYPDPQRPIGEKYYAEVVANSKRPGVMWAVAGMSLAPRLDERIAEIKVPTLIFLGAKDPDFKDVYAEEKQLRRELPQAEIEVLEGVGHYPQREVANLVVPRVLEWLSRQR